jgi:hypothetical protein
MEGRMSDTRMNIVTWERSESHGFPYFRSRGTHSAWDLHYDGDGWCLSQDGALVEWYGALDEAMAWVGVEEARTTAKIDTIDRIMPDEGDQGSYHRGLVMAMGVLCEFLPAGCGERIGVRLRQLRREFEGYEVPMESRDVVAGLAVGMVGYCLSEALEPSEYTEEAVLDEEGQDTNRAVGHG